MLVPNDEAKEVESGATKVFDESSLKTNSEFVRPMILVSEEAVDVGSKNKSGEMVVQEVDKKLLKEPEVMGFTTSRATCTPHFSGNKRSLDAAMNWVVEHEFDPDIVVNSHGICKLRLMIETYKLKGSRNNELGVVVWVALLSDYCNHGKSSIGKMVAKMVLELNPDNLEIHALVSKFFAKENMWDEVSYVRKLMKDSKKMKVFGYIVLDVNRKLHVFLMGDNDNNFVVLLVSYWREFVDPNLVEIKRECRKETIIVVYGTVLKCFELKSRNDVLQYTKRTSRDSNQNGARQTMGCHQYFFFIADFKACCFGYKVSKH
ncbi:hypothetical protein V6N12_032980 [Hibiscus sabdariffa]|uniref:UBA domain-containing protein n=1 Tax=Hibiscus sabdariffa TaxID=183260 RepID=A0ABR2ALR2_9ROSI